MYTIVKDYRHHDELRHSFNDLARRTFGLDFEDWYQNGFWGENYRPYSIVQDGTVIANVSVNHTPILWHDQKHLFIQLGTVMTDESHRNQGLIRLLMEEIEKDYADQAEGFYLFANDSVLDFYPRFGFRPAHEYQYVKETSAAAPATIQPIPMADHDAWQKLEKAIHESHCHGIFDMVDNSGLFMFYVSKFMQENVYYDPSLDTYVIAETDEDELMVHAIFCKENIALEDVILAFGQSVRKVKLGFTPSDPTGYTCVKIQEEDTTLFLKGTGLADFEKEPLMFPTLAHA